MAGHRGRCPECKSTEIYFSFFLSGGREIWECAMCGREWNKTTEAEGELWQETMAKAHKEISKAFDAFEE